MDKKPRKRRVASKLRTVKIVLEFDHTEAVPEHLEHYRKLSRPLRLVQCYGNRVRVVRGGVWSRQMFGTREALSAALLKASADARERALSMAGATALHYSDTADFLAAAAVAALEDPRVARMWVR